jgi:hypothetical protein
MHAHTFATQKRTMAPSQTLRGVAGSCAAVKGSKAPSSKRGGGSCPATPRSDARYPWPSAPVGGLDREVDFGSLVEGGPV